MLNEIIPVSFYVLFKWIYALYNPKIQQLLALPLYYLMLMVLMKSFLSLSRLSKQKHSDSASQERKSSRKNQIEREQKSRGASFQSLKKHLQSHTLQKWKPEWRARPLARFQAKKVQAERTGGISLRSVTKLERSSWAA